MATKEAILDVVGDLVRDRSTSVQNDILEPAFDLIMREMVQKRALRKNVRAQSTFSWVAAQRAYSFTGDMSLTRVPEEIHQIYIPSAGAGGSLVFLERRAGLAFEAQIESEGGDAVAGPPRIWRLNAAGTGIEVHRVPATADVATDVTIEYEETPTALATTATVTFVTDAEQPTLIKGILAEVGHIFEATRPLVVRYKMDYENGVGRMQYNRYEDTLVSDVVAPNEFVR